MGFVTLKKEAALAAFAYPENLAIIAGSYVELPTLIDCQVPDVFGLRIEKDFCVRVRRRFLGAAHLIRFLFGLGRAGLRIGSRSGLFFLVCRQGSRAELDAVNLAIRRCGGIEHAIMLGERLYLQLLRFKDDLRFPVGGNAIHLGRTAGRRIHVARAVGGDRPQIGGRGSVKRFELRGQLQRAFTADSYATGRALFEFVELRLLPGLRTVGKDPGGREKKKTRDIEFHEYRGLESSTL